MLVVVCVVLICISARNPHARGPLCKVSSRLWQKFKMITKSIVLSGEVRQLVFPWFWLQF